MAVSQRGQLQAEGCDSADNSARGNGDPSCAAAGDADTASDADAEGTAEDEGGKSAEDGEVARDEVVDEAEAIEIANNTRYGLATSVWTNDLGAAHRVARKVEVGIVWVNCWLHRDLRTPFGGVKDSGVGREGGPHSLDFFSELKNVCVALS